MCDGLVVCCTEARCLKIICVISIFVCAVNDRALSDANCGKSFRVSMCFLRVC